MSRWLADRLGILEEAVGPLAIALGTAAVGVLAVVLR